MSNDVQEAAIEMHKRASWLHGKLLHLPRLNYPSACSVIRQFLLIAGGKAPRVACRFSNGIHLPGLKVNGGRSGCSGSKDDS